MFCWFTVCSLFYPRGIEDNLLFPAPNWKEEEGRGVGGTALARPTASKVSITAVGKRERRTLRQSFPGGIKIS